MIPCTTFRTYFLACSVLILGASIAVCQDGAAPPAEPTTLQPGPACIDSVPACPNPFQSGPGSSTFLKGNHNFPNFINWMSNPIQNIDPRAVTALYPIFESAWFSSVPSMPDGDVQLYGAAATVALSERLAIGLNQGGFADMHLSHGQLARIVRNPGFATLPADRRARLIDIGTGGERHGFLNLGGFAQYTFIQDVPNQFLLTGGLRLEVPCGSHEMFQGYGPAEMSTYLTAGKEFGEFHVLATVGYQFPVGPGSDNEQFFNANIHFDRRLFGWLYPLVEFNCIYHTVSVGDHFDLPTRRGFVDFNNFSSTGNSVFVAAGANAVIVPERLEIGAVYSTNIAGQNNVNINTLLVKMTIRY
jgi:hypothetical protein